MVLWREQLEDYDSMPIGEFGMALMRGMGAMGFGDGQARGVPDRRLQDHREPDDGQGRSGWDAEGEWLPEGCKRCLHGRACPEEDELHFWTVMGPCRPACARATGFLTAPAFGWREGLNLAFGRRATRWPSSSAEAWSWATRPQHPDRTRRRCLRPCRAAQYEGMNRQKAVGTRLFMCVGLNLISFIGIVADKVG